jgi:aarF domain-containing kinase
MTYLLPFEWTSTFIPLQDKCPVSSYESIEEMFRRDTGEELLDYFSDFAHEPIGAASLAQVHLATVKESGQKVAVKVQHPGLAQWAPLDMALTKFTFSMLKRFFPEYDLEWLSSEMEVSLPQELDFQLEAANAIRTKQHFENMPELPLIIPEVLWAKKRILVMANESGHRLDDLDYLDSNGIDRDEVSATLAHIFNEMIFGRNAPLHCDPHGGNIAIRKSTNRRKGGKNFEIIMYDHGLYRVIPEHLQRSYAKMWLAVIDGDIEAMKQHAHDVAGITEEQFPLFASAITGRDYTSVVKTSILKSRSEEEKKTMGDALQEGLLSDLVTMLGQVPRIILLILKTNDLTRSLDESLHTRQGPMRTFLILAHYCARTVLREQIDEIRQRPGSLLSPGNAIRFVAAWMGFLRVELKLGAFELWLSFRRIVGLSTMQVGASVGANAGAGAAVI